MDIPLYENLPAYENIKLTPMFLPFASTIL